MATPSGASPQTTVQNGQPGKKAIIEEKFRKYVSLYGRHLTRVKLSLEI